MKTIIVSLFLITLLGCGQKRTPEARLAALETKISDLETNFYAYRFSQYQNTTNLLRLIDLFDGELRTNMHDIQVVRESLIDITKSFDGDIIAIRKRIDGIQAQPQPTGSPLAYKGGVPISVYNAIAAEYARKYPNDYDMQVTMIEEQVKAYKKLHP